MTKRLVLSAALLLACVSPLDAQDQGAATVVSLEDAVARALATSHRIAEGIARRDGAQAAIAVRRAAAKPSIAVNAGYTRTNHVDEFGVAQPNGPLRVIYPDVPDNYFTSVSLQWPIYTGGRIDALARAAEAESRAADADIAVTRADLRLEVVRTYWALATATESVRVLDHALARSDAHLRDVRSQFANGLVPPNEVSAAEAQRSRQQMLLIESRNMRSNVLEDMRRLTGVAGEIATAEPLAPALLDAPPAAVAPPPAARAEQQALSERLDAAEERVVAIEARRKPSLALTGAADYANPNPRIFPRARAWNASWQLGVAASWDLWDGGRISAEVAEASAATRAIRARQADLDASIDTEVRQRRHDLDSARASLVAAADAVRSAEESRRVVAERFNVGVATSTDVLDAQGMLLQAELDRTRALAAIRLADARLDRALGR